MAINVSVQYNGWLLPDIILLTQYYYLYHRGTRLNAMKKFCLCSLSHLNVLTFFPLTGGCSAGLDAFRLIEWMLYYIYYIDYNIYIDINHKVSIRCVQIILKKQTKEKNVTQEKGSRAMASFFDIIFPVQLTTTWRTGNLTRLIRTLAVCVTIHTHECARTDTRSHLTTVCPLLFCLFFVF